MVSSEQHDHDLIFLLTPFFLQEDEEEQQMTKQEKNYNCDAVPAAKVGMHVYALAVPEDTIGGRALARQLGQQKAAERKVWWHLREEDALVAQHDDRGDETREKYKHVPP